MKKMMVFCILVFCMLLSMTVSASSLYSSQTYFFDRTYGYYTDWTYSKTIDLTDETSGISGSSILLKWTTTYYPNWGHVQRVRLYRDTDYVEYSVSNQDHITITDFTGTSFGHKWIIGFYVSGSWVTYVDSTITFTGLAVEDSIHGPGSSTN